MRFLYILSFYALMMCFSSCVTLYKPNVIHSPLLTKKGEWSTSGSFGFSGSGLYNIGAAHAVSDHVGLLLDGMYHIRRVNNADSSFEKLNILSTELGAGYFSVSGTNKDHLFQCYAGGGIGKSTDRINQTNNPIPEVNAKYYNLFIQPGFALVKKNIIWAFDLRANYVKVHDIHAYLFEQFEWWNTDFRYYSGVSVDFLNLEPAFTLKAGAENLKVITQLGVIIPTINAKSYFDVNSSSLFAVPLIKLSVGINYTFGKSSASGK